jgi:excisionase family DNA binding protein
MTEMLEHDDDRYLGVPELARYAGLSEHTLRRHFVDATRPLRHYRLGGRILVKKSEFDAWMGAVAVGPRPQWPKLQTFDAIDRAVSEAARAMQQPA